MKRAHVIAHVVVAAVLALAGVGLSVHAALRGEQGPAGGGDRARAPSPGHALLSAFSWPAGTEYDYDFEWRAATSGELESRSTRGDFDLAGRLVLVSQGAHDGVTTLAARIDPRLRHAVTVFGGPLLPDDAAARATFDGQEALVDVDPRGTILTIRVPASAPPLFKTIAHGLLTGTAVTLPESPATSWTASEFGAHARAFVRYDVDALDRSTLHRVVLHREDGDDMPAGAATTRYGGQATVTLDPSGCVASLESRESAESVAGSDRRPIFASAVFQMHLVDRHAGPPPASVDLAAYEAHAPGEVAGAATAREKNKRLANGMAVADVRLSIGTYDGSPPPRGFITRASAMLRAQPDDDAEIAEAFDSAPAAGRLLAMDMLAGAGDARAQATMRELLGRKDVRANPRAFAELVQRFTFVREPEDASLEFVAAAYADARARHDAISARAAAFTLGAVNGRIAERARSPLTDRVHARLAADLAAAKEVDDQNALLAALGNEALPEALAPVLSMAESPRISTRAQVALALRRIDSPRAVDATFALLEDEDTEPATEALRSLAERGLDDAKIARLADAVVGGRVTSALDATLVVALSKAGRSGPDVERLLRFVAERDEEAQPDVSTGARRVLAQLTGATRG